MKKIHSSLDNKLNNNKKELIGENKHLSNNREQTLLQPQHSTTIMSICPAGYICDLVNYTITEPLRMYSCEQLQQDVIDQGYGDILAGIYCKYDSALISNCPSGHYCPAPDQEPILCRAGVYCPTKVRY